jgi:hypothetical protein
MYVEAKKTNNTNSESKDYLNSLKAIALFQEAKYEDALFSISKSLRSSYDNTLNDYKHLCQLLLSFEQKFSSYSQIKFSENWVEERLRQVVENYIEMNPPQSKYNYHSFDLSIEREFFQSISKKLENEHLNETLILGPENTVNMYDSGLILGAGLHYPFSQATDGWIFTKEQTLLVPMLHMEYDEDDSPLFVAPFPVKDWEINWNVVSKTDGVDCFYSTKLINETTHKFIQLTFDKLAKKRQDYFIPKYHNIIDPNLYCVKQKGCYQWTATDIIVEENIITPAQYLNSFQLCMLKLNKKLGKYILTLIKRYLKTTVIPKAHIASPIPEIPLLNNKEIYVCAEFVLNAALPLLSQLRRPALLLPGKLQAVVKAQRVYLKPGQEYEGVWHRDGKHENIVAVVIYYYRISKGLKGGDIEFIDKRPLNHGQHFLYFESTDELKTDLKDMPYKKVPLETGTLLVFSNYQNIHRVLKMICEQDDPNSPDGYSSRDFLLFFIVDQTKPLVSTSEVKEYDTQRYAIRNKVFTDQVKPSGAFVPDVGIECWTGNVEVGYYGWKEGTNVIEEDYQMDDKYDNTIFHYNENPPFGKDIFWVLENLKNDESDPE